MKKGIAFFLFVITFSITMFADSIVEYKVLSCDTLSLIARKFDVYMETILDYNNIDDPNMIYEGQILKIPSEDGVFYTVKEGDTIGYIANMFFTTISLLLGANNLVPSSTIYAGQELFIPEEIMYILEYSSANSAFKWPLCGVISSKYGWRIHPVTGEKSFHEGLDIAAPEGSPVFSSKNGIVTFAGENGGYGFMVEVRHSNGFYTRYGHLSHIDVTVGQMVNAGSILGRVGETGVATGPHLHFEIRCNGNSATLNPLEKLPSRAVLVYSEKYSGSMNAGGE
ncbi:MAG: hypothetical protein PWQ77_1423 [Kosmotogales bacterium]|nr:hypothetical protein [Kosmotogales bacterium]